MAGAGYKLFNTGDVLTAAQVNTYLMEQTVMVFANAAARTTALSGVVSEGMISYLKDTNAVEVYDGSNWVSSDDPNAIQNTIVDAKGDLITATAADTPSRIAVGNNGETLVADSSASTGLRWQGNFAAGKNKIINGDFGIWQRGTSGFSTGGAYNADRFAFYADGSGATRTISQQTFTPGTAPAAGYEAQYFWRLNQSVAGSGGSENSFYQPIEDVRTFAGQTMTFSFWAKADASRTVTVFPIQRFGSGGSSQVIITSQTANLTTSWARYSFTFAIPSVSGKTIGSGSALFFYIQFPVNTIQTIDIWGVQAEAGNTATAFQTATGTLAGELAACQRYYQRITSNNLYGWFPAWAGTTSTTAFNLTYPLITQMRIAPTSIEYGGALRLTSANDTGYAITSLTFAGVATPTVGSASGVCATATTNTHYRIQANNDAAAYIGWSAEL